MLAERIRFQKSAGVWLAWLLGAGLLAPSCNKSEGVPPSGEGAGTGPSSAPGGSSGSGAPGTGGSLIGPVTLNGGAAGAAGAPMVGRTDACAKSSDEVNALPSVLQLVVDTSGSMDWPPGWAPVTPDDSKPAGATKWETTREALLAAVDSLPGEVALGANFFPNVSQVNDTCLLNLVGAPIALLGGVASDVRAEWATAVGNVIPDGATPTHGAYRFGSALLDASTLPGNKFILLITDGTPTCTLDCQCTEDNLAVDSQPLVEEVAAAFAIGVRAFVIGSPGSEDTRAVLSQMAFEGGTGKPDCSDTGPVYCHFDMTTEPDLAGGLAQALDQIAMSVRSCEYSIPAAPTGEMLDPSLVNVLYTPSSGTTETIGRDPSANACHDGWQYSLDGRSIVLCGAACDRVKADADGKVEVLFGCETVTAPKPK